MAGFGKGDDLVTHDQVIEAPDVDHLEDFGQGSGAFEVFLAGLDAAGGMVMSQDDRRCIERQCLLGNLPGMDRASVNRTPGHPQPGQHLMPVVLHSKL